MNQKEVTMRKWMPVLVMGIFLATIWGCREAQPTMSDEEAIRALVSKLPYFGVDVEYTKPDTVEGPTKAPIQPIFWWREGTHLGIDLDIDIVGDSAFVTISRDCEGILHIITGGDTIDTVDKSLHDTFLRYAIFKRDTVPGYYRGWRIWMVSGAEATSVPNTVAIDSIRIQSTSYPDTVLTDPLTIVHRDDILTFGPNEQVIVTVYTNVDSACVFMHSFRRGPAGIRRHHRWRFTRVGNGIYQGVWYTPFAYGVHRAAVDVLHWNTLHDSEYVYDANAWLFPYRVK